VRTFIERVKPSGDPLERKIDEWKAMRAAGWDLHVLTEDRLSRRNRHLWWKRTRRTVSVIAFGYLPEGGAGACRATQASQSAIVH
jgi:hypothetical protein